MIRPGSVPGSARGVRIGGTLLRGIIVCSDIRLVMRVLIVGKFLGSVKAKAALSAAVGANVDEKQNPVFQNPPALGAMNVHASTPGTRFFGVVDEESEDAAHRNSIIARSMPGRNPGRNAYQLN
jgi:hypothetical protein